MAMASSSGPETSPSGQLRVGRWCADYNGRQTTDRYQGDAPNLSEVIVFRFQSVSTYTN